MDLGSGRKAGFNRGFAPNHEIVASVPEREGQRLARPFVKRLARTMGGRFRETGGESPGGGVADAGVGGNVAEQVDPINDVCHAPESIRGSRDAPAHRAVARREGRPRIPPRSPRSAEGTDSAPRNWPEPADDLGSPVVSGPAPPARCARRRAPQPSPMAALRIPGIMPGRAPGQPREQRPALWIRSAVRCRSPGGPRRSGGERRGQPRGERPLLSAQSAALA